MRISKLLTKLIAVKIISLSLLSHSSITSNSNFTCIGNVSISASTTDYEVNARKLSVSEKLSAEDVLARLIFAEGLSTGCLRDEDCNTVADFKISILTKIGWGIAKKFKNKNNENNPIQMSKDIYDTVFKKSLFRNSFVLKIDGNRDNLFAQAFLCPEKVKNYLGEVNLNYLDLLKAAHEIAALVTNNPIIGDYRFVTDFYYPKSPIFGDSNPDWVKKYQPIISNKWIRMYNLKNIRGPLVAKPNLISPSSTNR